MSTQSILDQCLPRIIEFRHRLHQIPELSYNEFKTAAAIRAELDRLCISHIDNLDDLPTATVALIGDPTKPCVALRADIDALPISEQTPLPYRSTHDGLMHACGHDGHAAILVGAASVLKSMEDKLPVCVKLLWQPAEEGGGGAERMVHAGVLDGRIGPEVVAIFGLHGWPSIKVGTIATKPGPLLAGTANFAVTFIGQGAHGAYPHLSHDPILAAAEAVLNLQQCVSRELNPAEPAVVTVGLFHAGTAVNIIPDTARIEGTVRTLSHSVREQMHQAISRRCAGIAAAHACQLKFDWNIGYPPTVNDPVAADYVAKIAKQTFGPNHFLPVSKSSMGAEDFAYYLEKIPGCFFMIGIEPADHPAYSTLHTAHYDFTDAALSVGIRMFTELVLNYPA